MYPEVAQKLRSEVLTHCGHHNAPTYDNIKNLKYSKFLMRHNLYAFPRHLRYPSVRAVINETLRLFPPVPLNVRESRAAPCALPPSDPSYPSSPSSSQPLYMPRNTTIMYFPLLTQRNPALWGSDADEFDPERWLDPERLAKFTANPMMYTPFSAGPRIVRYSASFIILY